MGGGGGDTKPLRLADTKPWFCVREGGTGVNHCGGEGERVTTMSCGSNALVLCPLGHPCVPKCRALGGKIHTSHTRLRTSYAEILSWAPASEIRTSRAR